MKVRATYVLWVLLVLFFEPLFAATPTDIDDRTREIATELRCVVCQNLSVADSPSEMAQQMRAIVREQVEAGKTTDEIKAFFVSKYGEWVLLKPKTSGISALLWILPYVVLVIGVIAALWFVRRQATKSKSVNAPATSGGITREELLDLKLSPPEVGDDSPRAEVIREILRLRAELMDLDFDYQSGKLSEDDHQSLAFEIANRGAVVLEKLRAMPGPASSSDKAKQAVSTKKPARGASSSTGFKRWQLIAGGTFLLLFGLTLGVMLNQSIRPRGGEGDTMTGDFLTGTTPSGGTAANLLAEGRQAFTRREFPKAIEAFKKVLAADPENAEAHSYMGFILVQAGHGDGALMAFDKALSRAPNFPMALWGKGMTLYQDKKDFAGARAIFEKLLTLMPPGAERNEVAKMLAEISAAGSAPAKPPMAAAASTGQSISGKITIDAKLKDRVDPQAALFIIARPAGGAAGPPLAVKKVDQPKFPVEYSLGQENAMMQGTPFAGKINITVRLDKDGNPATRGAGDMTGEYKKNPVDVGTKNADITIDQLAQ